MLACEYCGSTFTAEQIQQIMAQRQAKADAKAEENAAKEAARAAQDQAGAEGAAAAGAAPAAAANAATPQGDPIQAFLDRAPWTTASEENMVSYTCRSCAAELLVDSTTAITECPYCGNQDIIPNQVTGAMKPDYIIPFKLTHDQAIAGLQEHYRGKSLLPRAFTDRNHIEHIQGVYVPFWLYTYNAHGTVTYRGERIRTWVDGRGDTMQETSIFDVSRTGNMEFRNIPADGSSKMPDAHMDAIEPYDFSELQPFNVAYLPGFAAERYDQDAEAMQHRATGRMENSVITALASTVTGYDNVVPEQKSISADLEAVHYALLPVWMLHTRWKDNDYLFAMNGQTGKMIGDLPIDGKKQALFFLLPAILLFIIVFVVVFIFFR